MNGRALRRIVMDRLIAAAPALGGRVYDRATQQTAFPYLTLGPSYGVDASAQCIRAREITLQIDVWGDATNKGVLEDVVDEVTAALHGWSDPLQITMRPLLVSLTRIMDEPNNRVHGVVQIETVIEADI